jgi:ribosomal protein L40E
MEALTSELALLAAYVEIAPPKWLFIAMIVAFVLIVSAATRRQSKSDAARWEVRICPRCGANEPPHAMFCGSCGTRIDS